MSPICTHAIYEDDHESESSECVELGMCREAFGHREIVGPGLDFLEDGIFIARIQIGRNDDDAMDHGSAISTW